MSDATRVFELVHEIAGTYHKESDLTRATETARPLIAELLEIDKLRQYGVPRFGHHIQSSSWLYYDSQIGMLLGRHPKDQVVPVHDHGTWELVTPWTGRIDYRSYVRLDDGSTPGRSTLEVTDDRVLLAGDLEIVERPPGDIHGWTVLDDDTWLFAITGPALPSTRHYFDVEAGTHEERKTKAARDDDPVTTPGR